MVDEPKPPAGVSYNIGNVGAGAQVAQGTDIRIVGHATAADAETLQRQFQGLLDRIASSPEVDDDSRALAQEATQAVAAGLANVEQQPAGLRLALKKAATFCTGATAWVAHELATILKSDAAQKTLGTVTEAATKAAIASFIA